MQSCCERQSRWGIMPRGSGPGTPSLPTSPAPSCSNLRRNVVIMDNLSNHMAPPVRAASATSVPRSCSFRPRRSPAPQPGFRPHRDGLPQAESTSAKSGPADRPRTLDCHQPYRRPLLASGMLKLLRSRWLRRSLTRNRSRPIERLSASIG